MSFTVKEIPCLSDNYAYLVVCEETHQAAIVDASEAGPVVTGVRDARAKGFVIWSTHHHPDHVGGNLEVAQALKVREVYAHASDRGRIPGQTQFLDTGASFKLGALSVETLHIPGHTLGAIAYVVSSKRGRCAVFTGDTLFVAGCGRLFEGTPAQMLASLESLARLEDATEVFCGHEYTVNNLRFAAHAEPSNPAVVQAMEKASARRAKGQPTVPSTMGEEKRTNPFLRTGQAEIRRSVGVATDADSASAFAAVRLAKDGFR
jgi:hydroxyacylglutathione hydrolase